MEKVTVETIAKGVVDEIITKDGRPFDDDKRTSMVDRIVTAFWDRVDKLNQAIVTRQAAQEAAEKRATIAEENSVRLTARNTALEAAHKNARRDIEAA